MNHFSIPPLDLHSETNSVSQMKRSRAREMGVFTGGPGVEDCPGLKLGCQDPSVHPPSSMTLPPGRGGCREQSGEPGPSSSPLASSLATPAPASPAPGSQAKAGQHTGPSTPWRPAPALLCPLPGAGGKRERNHQVTI